MYMIHWMLIKLFKAEVNCEEESRNSYFNKNIVGGKSKSLAQICQNFLGENFYAFLVAKMKPWSDSSTVVFGNDLQSIVMNTTKHLCFALLIPPNFSYNLKSSKFRIHIVKAWSDDEWKLKTFNTLSSEISFF